MCGLQGCCVKGRCLAKSPITGCMHYIPRLRLFLVALCCAPEEEWIHGVASRCKRHDSRPAALVREAVYRRVPPGARERGIQAVVEQQFLVLQTPTCHECDSAHWLPQDGLWAGSADDIGQEAPQVGLFCSSARM
jgi:hypothetical protein